MKANARFRMTLIYLALATAWIGLSDRALGSLIADPRRLMMATTLAGWLFVLGTGIMLFWMMGRGQRQRPSVTHHIVQDDHERMTDFLLYAMKLARGDSGEHARRVAHLAEGLGRLAGLRGEDLRDLKCGALLRDVGHLATPKAHIEKLTRLTPKEMAQMRQHPQVGHNLLEKAGFPPTVIDIVHAHHERWDGFGYPRGLSGEAIPLAARIVSIVDVWEALGSDRGYRRGWPKSDVLAYMQQGAGCQFDPELTALFIAHCDQLTCTDGRGSPATSRDNTSESCLAAI